MTVAVVMEFEGATLNQYDDILGWMGFNPGGKGPEGCLFHWACSTDTGMRVTDVWEDRAKFDHFAEEQIGPLSAKAGITTQPTITSYNVHNYLKG